MKTLAHRVATATLAAITCLAFAAVATDFAFARGGHGGGHGGGSHGGGSRGGGHGGSHGNHGSHSHSRSHASYGFFFGAPIYWGGYYYPRSYYYPVVPAPPLEMGYIEQGNDLYYCSDTSQYYPEVMECPSGWVLVTPQPAPPS